MRSRADSRGFVLTRPTLQVKGYDNLFAVGDCATLIGTDHGGRRVRPCARPT
jgi:NADH dehydrogenase FAD-containing subunit